MVSILAVPACGARSGDTDLWQKVSGENAMTHVQRLVDLGPRPPGSEALEKARQYIEKQLVDNHWQVSRQSFEEQTPRGKITFTNLIARFAPPSAKERSRPSFLLCSHYDTKSFESIRFVGANDGGSSTGLLVEISRVLALNAALASNVELVFFDGEEAFENFSATDGIYGSRHFAQELIRTNTATQFRGGLLFDMIGDRSLTITLPPDSPAKMADNIFASAEALKAREHFTYFDQNITDDHTPLNAAGVPTVDLIDFDFASWHTAEDTMDKLSAGSLQTVGSVALYYLSQFALR